MNPQEPTTNPVVPTIQSPISPLSSQIPQPIKPERDSHWISILAMAVFVVLSLGVVAFLYYQNQALKSMLASFQTPVAVASPSPIATTDPTADWKTFVDSNTGLTFKYPQRLSLPMLQGAGMAIPEGEFALSDSTSGSNHPFTIDMIKYNEDLASFTKKYTYYESASKLQMTNLNVSSPLGDLVNNSNGLAMYKYINTYDQTINPGAKDIINYKAIFILKNYGFIVSSSNTVDTLSEFNQILSTFKFTGATPTPISSVTPIYEQEGGSCGAFAGAAGDAQCAPGLTCRNQDPNNYNIGTCAK